MGQLIAGTSLRDVINGFMASPEYQPQSGLSDDAFLERLYQGVLDRPSDSGGKAFWTNKLATGTSRADVVIGFLTSGEFTATLTTG